MNSKLMILSNDNKKHVLKKNNNIINVKYMSFSELKNKLLFSYDEHAIYEVMKREGLSVSNAKIILDNLYFLDSEEDNLEVNNLKRIYNYLNEEGLIIFSEFIRNSIRKSNVVLYGRDYVSKEEKKLLENINYSLIDSKVYDKDVMVFSCDTIEDEVRNLAREITLLIKRGVDASNIKIVNLDDTYRMNIEKIFPRYNIPTNIMVKTSVFSLPFTKGLINAPSLEEGLRNLSELISTSKDKEIYDVILECVNKYASLPDDDITRSIIKYELKNKNVVCESVVNAVSEGDTNTIYGEDEYIFIVNFNQGVIPRIYKDEDYLSDKVKIKLGRDTCVDKTINENKRISYFISHNKNVFISYKKRGVNETFYPSSFLEQINKCEVNVNEDYTLSNIDNKIILSRKLDNYYKYGDGDKYLISLNNKYNDLPYKKYDNSFSGINSEETYEKLTLSSTSLDIFNRCAFRYYLKYVLKIGEFEESFMQSIGNIFHYVLSKYKEDNFDLRSEWDNYVRDNITINKKKEGFFLDKLYKELEYVITEIKRQNSYRVKSDEFYETKIIVNPTNQESVEFLGIVDKIIYNEENNFVSVIDYKTGGVNLDLSLLKFGIGMQLPIYLYLIRKCDDFKDADVAGFYIQRIISPLIMKDKNKSYLDMKSKNLYLQGYSLGDIEILEKFDKSYQDSKVIKSLKINSNGFSHYSKVLSREEMDLIEKTVEENVKSVIEKIENRDFKIDPKRVNEKLVGCEYCSFKDICNRREKDIVNLVSEVKSDA